MMPFQGVSWIHPTRTGMISRSDGVRPFRGGVKLSPPSIPEGNHHPDRGQRPLLKNTQPQLALKGLSFRPCKPFTNSQTTSAPRSTFSHKRIVYDQQATYSSNPSSLHSVRLPTQKSWHTLSHSRRESPPQERATPSLEDHPTPKP